MLAYNLLNAQQVTYIEAISIAKKLYKYKKTQWIIRCVFYDIWGMRLFHCFHCGFDSAAGFFEFVFRSGVGEADALVVAKGTALYGGNVGIQ